MKKPKTRGQISIDLIFTVLLAIVLTGTIVALLSEVTHTQQKIEIKRELSQSALDLSTIILQTQALKDTNFLIEIEIKPIYYLEKTTYPKITVNDTNIVISENITGEGINSIEQTKKPSWTQVTTVGTKLVIKNA